MINLDHKKDEKSIPKVFLFKNDATSDRAAVLNQRGILRFQWRISPTN